MIKISTGQCMKKIQFCFRSDHSLACIPACRRGAGVVYFLQKKGIIYKNGIWDVIPQEVNE